MADSSVVSLREAMERMNGMPALPDGARRGLAVRCLRLHEAPQVLRAVSMRSATWRVYNLTAVTQMANAYGLLGILSIAAFPARVDNPHDYAGNLAWIRDCEVQLRQCAIDVGRSFSVEAIPLCDDILHHVNASAHQSLNWIARDAKALLKRVTKLHKSAHTLSQAADPCDEPQGQPEQQLGVALSPSAPKLLM